MHVLNQNIIIRNTRAAASSRKLPRAGGSSPARIRLARIVVRRRKPRARDAVRRTAPSPASAVASESPATSSRYVRAVCRHRPLTAADRQPAGQLKLPSWCCRPRAAYRRARLTRRDGPGGCHRLLGPQWNRDDGRREHASQCEVDVLCVVWASFGITIMRTGRGSARDARRTFASLVGAPPFMQHAREHTQGTGGGAHVVAGRWDVRDGGAR